MKKLLIVLLTLVTFSACTTKQLIVDTGTVSPLYKGNMMEYLRSDKYNWELTVELIEHAGLTDLFEGKVDSLSKITFFGFKSYSVLRFLYDSQHKDPSKGVFIKVQDIPVSLARELVLKHVVKNKYLKESVAYRNREYLISAPQQDGGTNYTTVQGNILKAYLESSAYGGVPDAGAVIMGLYSITASRIVPMATPDIQPDNGVVHALNYGYELGVI